MKCKARVHKSLILIKDVEFEVDPTKDLDEQAIDAAYANGQEPTLVAGTGWEEDFDVEEAVEILNNEESKEGQAYSQGTCQKCGQPSDRLLAVDAEAPPTPECPMGYGSEMRLCPGCLQKWEEE